MFAGGLAASVEALAAITAALLGPVDTLGGAPAPSAMERSAAAGLGERGARAESGGIAFAAAATEARSVAH